MAEYWPYDEDENLTDDADQVTNKQKRNFIQSTCVVDGDASSIEINGADLNVKLTVAIFEQIHHHLLRINHDQQPNTKPAVNTFVFDISSELHKISNTLISFRLLYVEVTPHILALLHKILALSQSTLTEIQLELLVPLPGFDKRTQEAKDLHISGTFEQIMRLCSSLPTLHSIGIDLINFPLYCYSFFAHFRAADSFLSLTSLTLFLCQENVANQGNFEQLLSFLRSHDKLDAIRVIVNDGDEGIWEDLQLILENVGPSRVRALVNPHRFSLTESDIRALSVMCRQIIACLNKSPLRRQTLTAFSLCHYLEEASLPQFSDVLLAFVSSHPKLCELSLSFESVSDDRALSQLLRAMHGQPQLMQNLEFIDFQFSQSLDMDHAFPLSNKLQQLNVINDHEAQDTDEDAHRKICASGKKNLCFGRDSLVQCAELLDKCPGLIQLHLKCYYGVDMRAFRRLSDSVVGHSNLKELSIHKLQRQDGIFESLARMMARKQHSFMDTLSVIFNRHYLDTLRRGKYTIPDSYYEPLQTTTSNSHSMENQMRPKCDTETVLKFVDGLLQSQHHLLRYMQSLRLCLSGKWMNAMVAPNDVIDILIGYLVYTETDDENVLRVTVENLPRGLKSSLESYFKRRYNEQSRSPEFADNMHRMITLNNAMAAGVCDHDDEIADQYEDDSDDLPL